MSDPLIMQAIARLVPQGARVLDLGCGDGALLAYLQQHKGCTGYGVELDDANVQHTQTQRQGTVIYLLACLSYIVLAMGSLAFQHRRLRNS